jgi:energy-coupling factor transporter transmembrane protein EcfT
LDLNAIILILLAAGIIFFATRAIGKGLKIVIQVFLGVIVVLALLTALTYKDMESLKRGFQEGNNTFALYDDGQLYSAIILKPMTNITLTIDSFDYLTEEDIAKSQEAVKNNNFSVLLNKSNSHRIFIFKPQVMNLSYTMNLGPGMNINQDDMLSIIMSDEPYKLLAQRLKDQYDASEESLEQTFESFYGDKERFKGYLFAALLSNYFTHQKPGELVKNFRNKNITVYPETISFKIIRYMPWA